VTRRIPVDAAGVPTDGAYYGPFASRRSARAFAERILDLFKVRRCQIKIRRDPTFPGCLYSEMKMCFAPCFAGCTKEEYDVEVQRLVQFLETSGGSLRSTMEDEREKASEQLDFERAAALHKKVEKLDEVLRGRPELTRRIQDLDGVILQRAAEEQTIGVYVLRGGRLADPFFLRFAENASQARSAEQIIREHFEAESATTDGDLGEHLWLVARWYYSNPREGEIFFREKDWPYRRILRACSRLLAPKASEAETNQTPGPVQPPEGAS
jgi:excinuclease UvrABC nuclease subunit